ncbi:Nuclear distribution protein PAC1-1 [Hondaea fermentalgiana]|uniref:Nuclear distribution protein PAC1-1 n=1 Tax=Hondaea fermentalgiana TaxID=2315210 RepID=A0A2R5G1C8_9STRA|nr:Nuclear distribution protein PAC1-1 [Hondaea fermentalgiana]|eukprot:GBG24827.1 Nuclear distribution protein PAC1-1 [Hondaea fermentalgiana]
MSVLRAAVLVCEDKEVWSDLGPIWARALFGAEGEEGDSGAQEVLVRHAGDDEEHLQQEGEAAGRLAAGPRQEVVFFNVVKRELPRKDLLFRSGQDGGIDLIVLTGSRHSVNDPDQAEWLGPLEDLVRLVVRERPAGFEERTLVRPRVIAGCFGAQVVAKALGGQVAKNPDSRFVFGAERIEPTPALGLMRWAPLGAGPMRVLESHGECVETLPPGSVHLASSPSCRNEMFFIPVLAPNVEPNAPGGVLALQSHPEFEIEHMLDRILPSIDAAGLVDARQASQGVASMDEGPLNDSRLLAMLRSFAWGETVSARVALDNSINSEHGNDSNQERLEHLVNGLREAFHAECRRLASSYEEALAAYRAKDPSTAAGEADANYATYSSESDKQRVACAEALLRGEAGLPDLLSGDFPQGHGDRATVIDSSKNLERLPFSDANRERFAMRGMHTMNILCVAATRVGALGRPLVFSGGADKLFCATDPATGRQAFGPFRCTAPVVGIKFRPKTTMTTTTTTTKNCEQPEALVICMDGKVNLLRTKASLADLVSQEGASTLSETGMELVPGSEIIKGHTKMATALAWSEDGAWFASAGRDHTVHVYQVGSQVGDDANAGASDRPIQHARTLQCADCPDALAFVECLGSLCLVVAVRGDYRLQYLCVERREDSATLPVGSVLKVNMNAKGDDFVSFSVLDMACAPGGLPILAVATDKSRIILFKAGSTQQFRNLYGHTCSEFSRSRIAWDPTGRYVVSNSETPVGIVVWDVATGEKVQELQGHAQSIRDVAVLDEDCAPFAGHVLTCSFDRSVQLFPPALESSKKG